MQKSNLLQKLVRLGTLKKCLEPQYRNYFPASNLPTSCRVTKVNLKSLTQLEFPRFAHQTSSLKCWKCGADRKLATDLTCDQCNVVQPPHESRNFFTIFNLPQDFDVDQQFLRTKYRKLQAVLHPDKYSNKSEDEKLISADYSALVNKAYNTLQAPLSRAIHMLSLHGVQIDEDQKVTDPGFLMEIMELNEEVEAAEGPEQLRKLNEKNKGELERIGKEVSAYFKAGQVEKAKDCVIKMKYYNSVSLHVNGLLRERGIVD